MQFYTTCTDNGNPPENSLIHFSRYWTWKIVASFTFSWGWCCKFLHSCSLHPFTWLPSIYQGGRSRRDKRTERNSVIIDRCHVCIIIPAVCHQRVKNFCYSSWVHSYLCHEDTPCYTIFHDLLLYPNVSFMSHNSLSMMCLHSLSSPPEMAKNVTRAHGTAK